MRNGQQPKSQGQIEPGEEFKAILALRVYIYQSKRKSWGIQLHFWWLCRPRATKIKTWGLPKSETLINHPFQDKTPKDLTSKVRVKQKQSFTLNCSPVLQHLGCPGKLNLKNRNRMYNFEASWGEKMEWDNQSSWNQERKEKTKYRTGKTNKNFKIRWWM